jgi:ABC-type multidrug transport system fused ATPase/permease subunit
MQKILVNDVDSLFGVVVAILMFLTDAFMILFIMLFLLIISFTMTLIVILMTLFCGSFYYIVFRKKIVQWGGETYDKQVEMIKTANQAFGGIKEVKVMRREGFFINEFVARSRSYATAWRKFYVNSNILKLTIEAVCFGGAFLFIALFMLNGSNLAPLVPKLGIFILAAFRLLPAIARDATYINGIMYSGPIVDAVYSSLFDEFSPGRAAGDGEGEEAGAGDGGEAGGAAGTSGGEEAACDGEAPSGAAGTSGGGAEAGDESGAAGGAFGDGGAPGGETASGAAGELEGYAAAAGDIDVTGVTFTYPLMEAPTLENLSITIPYKKAVALIGASGAGKTTLADIILGILAPDSGQVTYDGMDVHEGIDRWAKCISYIPQQIYLLDESIAENIAFGIPREEIDEAKIQETLVKSQLSDFVATIPGGIHTIVGERGIRLSGGQRQRIGIARALYNDTPILVLDEATSSLDNDTEKAVMDAIMGLHGEKTLIIVAHRLSTIEHCDIVYRVEGRKAVRVR